MIGDRFKAAGLTFLLGSPGQLLSRIRWYKCSINKPWLFLFIMPPFSIVPAIMFLLGKVEPSKVECKDSLDKIGLIMGGVILLIGLILDHVLSLNMNDVSGLIALYSISFILIFLVRWYKTYDICKIQYNALKEEEKKTKKMRAIQHYIKANNVISVIGLVIFVLILSIVSRELSFVPFIGLIFSVWNTIGHFPGLQLAITSVLYHYIKNIYDASNPDGFICFDKV